MAESKLIQLVLDERDAETVAGALAVALVVVTGGRTARGLGPVSGILMLKEPDKLGCSVAELYGLPCPHHHGKKVPDEAVAVGKADALQRMERIHRILCDFSDAYRTEKVEAFPGEGDERKPNFKN